MNDGCVIRVEIVDGIHFPALCHYPIESLDSRGFCRDKDV
jgi:hypothetical protein